MFNGKANISNLHIHVIITNGNMSLISVSDSLSYFISTNNAFDLFKSI